MRVKKQLKINITFTGICAFIEHEHGATVVIPNARQIIGVTHAGAHSHVPPHLPFLEATPQQGLTLNKLPPLFTYTFANKLVNVVELGGRETGVALEFKKPPEGAKFLPQPASLNWNNVVDMEKVLGIGNPIDDTLVSFFEPRSDRVSVRVPIRFGSIDPQQQSDVHAAFLPTIDPLYSGFFVQEVVWKVTYEEEKEENEPVSCVLQERPFKSGVGDDLVTFTGMANETKFDVTVGNAPIDDIIRAGTGSREIVDHHFAKYYELLLRQPPLQRLPHRTSEKDRQSRTGAANCPPAKISLR